MVCVIHYSLNGQQYPITRPQRSSLNISPDLCTVELEERSHTHSSHHSGLIEGHSRQVSGLSHHSLMTTDHIISPDTHPRQVMYIL